MTRITSPCPCGCGGIYDREDDQQTSANVDTYPPEPPRGHIRRTADLIGTVLAIAAIRVTGWAIDRAHRHSTPLDVLKETR